MSLLFWVSLAFIGTVTIGGIALLVVRVVDLFRASRSFARVIAAGSDRILSAAETVEQRGTSSGQLRFGDSLARLESSVGRAGTVFHEVRRIQRSLAGIRGAVPRK